MGFLHHHSKAKHNSLSKCLTAPKTSARANSANARVCWLNFVQIMVVPIASENEDEKSNLYLSIFASFSPHLCARLQLCFNMCVPPGPARLYLSLYTTLFKSEATKLIGHADASSTTSSCQGAYPSWLQAGRQSIPGSQTNNHSHYTLMLFSGSGVCMWPSLLQPHIHFSDSLHLLPNGKTCRVRLVQASMSVCVYMSHTQTWMYILLTTALILLLSLCLSSVSCPWKRTGSASLRTANYYRIGATLHQRPPHSHSSFHTPTHTQTPAYIFGVAFSEVHYKWQNYYPLWQHVYESTTGGGINSSACPKSGEV